eukprot:g25303.t1
MYSVAGCTESLHAVISTPDPDVREGGTLHRVPSTGDLRCRREKHDNKAGPDRRQVICGSRPEAGTTAELKVESCYLGAKVHQHLTTILKQETLNYSSDPVFSLVPEKLNELFLDGADKATRRRAQSDHNIAATSSTLLIYGHPVQGWVDKFMNLLVAFLLGLAKMAINRSKQRAKEGLI